MTETQSPRIFRIDKFVVSTEAREEFLRQARRTHDLLADQPGFVQHLLLEQSGGSGKFNIVTMVEWESEEAIENVREEVGAMHERDGFDPQELFARLGIEADIATYTLLGE